MTDDPIQSMYPRCAKEKWISAPLDYAFKLVPVTGGEGERLLAIDLQEALAKALDALAPESRARAVIICHDQDPEVCLPYIFIRYPRLETEREMWTRLDSERYCEEKRRQSELALLEALKVKYGTV